MKNLSYALILGVFLTGFLSVDAGARDGNSLESNSLLKAVRNGNRTKVASLLSKGADVNVKSKTNGRTALMLAAKNGNVTIVHALIEKGADIKARDTKGHTALMMAAKSGSLLRSEKRWNQYYAIVKTLKDKGADINAENRDGRTALSLATRNANLKMLETLIDLGAEVNIEDNKGRTPLMYTKNAGRFPEAVDFLKSKGGKDFGESIPKSRVGDR